MAMTRRANASAGPRISSRPIATARTVHTLSHNEDVGGTLCACALAPAKAGACATKGALLALRCGCTMGNTRILVVDDEPDVLGFIQQLLEKKGYDVDTATSGTEALAIVAEKAPALLITDLRMPELDGIELLARIREQDRELPGIVLTAAGDVATAV